MPLCSALYMPCYAYAAVHALLYMPCCTCAAVSTTLSAKGAPQRAGMRVQSGKAGAAVNNKTTKGGLPGRAPRMVWLAVFCRVSVRFALSSTWSSRLV